jgi:hypothetical protein
LRRPIAAAAARDGPSISSVMSQFVDIANGKEIPSGALRNIDLWTE